MNATIAPTRMPTLTMKMKNGLGRLSFLFIFSSGLSAPSGFRRFRKAILKVAVRRVDLSGLAVPCLRELVVLEHLVGAAHEIDQLDLPGGRNVGFAQQRLQAERRLEGPPGEDQRVSLERRR